MDLFSCYRETRIESFNKNVILKANIEELQEWLVRLSDNLSSGQLQELAEAKGTDSYKTTLSITVYEAYMDFVYGLSDNDIEEYYEATKTPCRAF